MAQGQQRHLDPSGRVQALQKPSPDLLVRTGSPCVTAAGPESRFNHVSSRLRDCQRCARPPPCTAAQLSNLGGCLGSGGRVKIRPRSTHMRIDCPITA